MNVNLMLGQIGNGAGALLQMSGSNGGQDQGTETGSFAELIAALQVPATKTPNQVQGQGNTGDPPMTALEQLVQQLGEVPDRQQNASLILTQMVKELTSEAVNEVQRQGNTGESPMTAIAQLLQQLSEMSDQQQNASLIFTQIARELTNEAAVSQAEGQAESGEQEEKALNLARLFNEVGHALGETGIADFYLGQTGAFRQKDPQLPIRELTKTLKSDLGLAGIVKDLLAKVLNQQQGQGRTEEQSRKIVTPLLQQLKQTSGEQPDKNLGFGQAGGMEDVATTTFPVDSPDGQDIAELLAMLLSSPDEATSKPGAVAGKQLQSEFVELLQQLRGTGVQQPVSHLAHDKKVVQSSTHQPVKAELTKLLQQLGDVQAQEVDGKAKDILGAFSLVITQIAENLQDLGPTQLALGNNKKLTDDVLRQVSHQLGLGEGNETVNRLLQFLSTNREQQELIPTRQIVKLVEALVNQTAGDRDAAGKNGLTEPRQSSDSAKNGILKLVNTSEGINHRGQTLGKNDLQAENQQSILSVGKGVEDNQQLSQQLRHALETLGLSKEQTKQYLHVVNRLNQGLQVKSQDLTRLVGDIVMHADGLLKELSVGTDKIKNLISNFMPEKVDYPRTKMTSSKQPSDNLPGAQKAAVSKDAGHNNANSSNDQEENTKQLASGKEMTIASVHQKGNSGTDFSKVFNQTRSQEMGESVFKQIVEKTQLISTEGKQEIQIKLKPQHLGQLSLKVEHTDAGLVAKIAVESHKVQELVKEYLPRLKETLQAQGIKIGQMNVTVQDEGNQQQSQLFQFQQQQRFNRGKQWGYGGRNSSSEVVDGQSVDDRRNTDQLVDYLA